MLGSAHPAPIYNCSSLWFVKGHDSTALFDAEQTFKGILYRSGSVLFYLQNMLRNTLIKRKNHFEELTDHAYCPLFKIKEGFDSNNVHLRINRMILMSLCIHHNVTFFRWNRNHKPFLKKKKFLLIHS